MIDCVYHVVSNVLTELLVVINLDDLPTRRLLGDVVTATPVGTLPT